MPKISVVIPCYNAAKWLDKCFDSLKQQTFTDFEIVAVNDASTDETQAKLQHLASEEPRLQLLNHAVNRGVSQARNTALTAAQGEYITFLDADDQLPKQALEQYAQKADNDNADLICLNASKCDAKGNSLGLFCPKRQPLSFNPLAEQEIFYQYQSLFASACVKLYRHSLLQKFRLTFNPAMKFGEDTLFVHQYVGSCQKIIIDTSIIAYHYLQQPHSAVHTIKLDDRLAQLEYLIKALYQLGQENHFSNRFCAHKCAEYVWSLKKFSTSDNDREKALNSMLKSDFYSKILLPVLTRHGKFKHRLLMRLFAHFPLASIKLW